MAVFAFLAEFLRFLMGIATEWITALCLGLHGGEKTLGGPYSSLPLPEGVLWESSRGTFYTSK